MTRGVCNARTLLPWHLERQPQRTLAAIAAHLRQDVASGGALEPGEVQLGLLGQGTADAAAQHDGVDVDRFVAVQQVVVLRCARTIAVHVFVGLACAVAVLRTPSTRGHVHGVGGVQHVGRVAGVHVVPEVVRKVLTRHLGRVGPVCVARVGARHGDARHALGHAPTAVGRVCVGLARVLAGRKNAVHEPVLAHAVACSVAPGSAVP